MKVAYVSIWDATDIRNWSGLDLNIWRAVEAAGVDVELVGNLHVPPSLRRRVRRLWGERVERKAHLRYWDVDTARGLAESASKRLASVSADAILGPSPVPLAFLRDRRPIVVWTDATFAGLSASYPEFSPDRLAKAAVRSGRAIDAATARNCAVLAYSSAWGATSAVAECGADAHRVRTIPFGANVDAGYEDGAAAARAVAGRELSKPLLLFVGVDWDRKGGLKAVAVTARLRAAGVEAKLLVVGCRPPAAEGALVGAEFVQLIEFIDKTTTAGRAQLADLFRAATLLIVPSTAEAYGLVFAEAAAFAVPSVSHRVGGIGTVVQDGRTGRLFDLADPVEDWARWITDLLADRARYQSMANAAFADYGARLNWKVAGGEMRRTLEAALEAHVPDAICASV